MLAYDDPCETWRNFHLRGWTLGGSSDLALWRRESAFMHWKPVVSAVVGVFTSSSGATTASVAGFCK